MLSRLYEHRRALAMLFSLVCLALLVAQNMDTVEIRFAFFSIQMPRFASVAAGVLVGLLIGLLLRRNKAPAEKPALKTHPPEAREATRKQTPSDAPGAAG